MFRRKVMLLIAIAMLWKVFRTDWIVQCKIASADFHPPVSVEYKTATYIPPVSPIWYPPTPSQITGRPDAKWRDPEFFEGGGSYGPISEPVLAINWLRVGAKAFALIGLLWLFLKKRK